MMEPVPDATRRSLLNVLGDVLIYARAAVDSLQGVTPSRAVELNQLFNIVHNVPAFIEGTHPLGFDEPWFEGALLKFDQKNGTNFAGVYQSERTSAFAAPLDDCERHFLALLDLISRLPTLPAEVLDQHYSRVAFGSWWLTVRHEGCPFRISFDGKESVYRIERASRNEPSAFSVVWEQDTGTGALPDTLLAAIREAG